MKTPMIFCALAALTAGADPANPYGATAHVSRDEFEARERTFELCHAMGMGQIRFDYQMNHMRPDKDAPWDFTRYDRIVASAEKFGVTMLPILFAPVSAGRAARSGAGVAAQAHGEVRGRKETGVDYRTRLIG